MTKSTFCRPCARARPQNVDLGLELGLLGGRRDDADGLASALDPELDGSGFLGEQRVIAAATDARAGMELGAALTDQDFAGLDDLAAEPLHAQPLRGRVAAIARAGSALLVCHLYGLRSVLSVLSVLRLTAHHAIPVTFRTVSC